MREMKDTGVVWCPTIPKEWHIEKVKNYFYISKDLATETNPTVLKLARSGICVKDVTTNEGQMAESYDNYNKVKAGDLLLNPMDLYSGANCNVSEIEGVISPAYTNLRLKASANSKFYDYYFKTQYWAMAMFAHGKGVSYDNRWTINAEGVKNYEIPVPSIEEQNAIVESIQRDTAKVDALIANQESQIEKLKAYKQSIITEVVTKGLDPNVPMKDSGVEWVKTIPDNWDMVYPKALFAQRKDRALPTDEQLTASQQYGIMNQQEYMRVTGSRVVVVEKDFSILKHVSKGDFVISMRSFQGGLEYSEVEGCISSAYVMLKPNSEKVFPKYYRWLLKSSLYINSLQSTSDLIRDGQAMRFANFIKIWLPCPPFEEQQQIASYLDDVCPKIDSLIAIKQSKIEKLNQYKRSLIYEYVTGKKEVM